LRGKGTNNWYRQKGNDASPVAKSTQSEQVFAPNKRRLSAENCPRCGKVFTRSSASVCPACEKKDAPKVEKVISFIHSNPPSTLVEIAVATGVPMKYLLRFLEDGILMEHNEGIFTE